MISNDGGIGTQIVYGAQDVFPLTLVYRVLLGQSLYVGPETYHYKAMTDCQVYTLGSSELIEGIRKNPNIYKELFSEAGYHLATSIQRIENTSMGSAHSRVAHILLFYAQIFGDKKLIGVQIRLPLTHQDIADTLNVTRETVSKSMIKLRKKGVIKTASKNIIVPDIDQLSQEAYG